ncbi:MAG: chloride channel protein [Methanomassiliicoccus sp.]|nr:chloride channel protein [Methanomassiliicoccus sp.]
MTSISFIEGLHRSFDEDLGPYLRKWIPISIAVGIVSGLGAIVFQLLLNLVWNISYDSYVMPWYVLLMLPAVGGLLAGIVMMRFAPETAGPGTDHVISSMHHDGGKIRGIVAPVKMIASALTIGTGGSSGNEGPISQISASIASTIGTRMKLSRSEMRILVVAGMAAGWSAVFRAPLGSAIFAIEVPYKNDFEGNAAIPSIISSVTSYLVFVPFGGGGPIFSSDLTDVPITADLLSITLILGAIIGLIGILFVYLMKRVTGVFRGSKLPLPATTFIGGFLVGIIGLEYPQILGLGEGTIQLILGGTTISIALLIGILLAKMVATSFTVGSGGSGGIFFPSLIIGGAIGGSIALLLNLQPYPLFVLVGMGAMMAGVSKTPIAAAVLVTEMVGGYVVLIPLMIASTVSYLVSGKWSLYESQITSCRIGVDFSTLGGKKVKDIMSRDPVTVSSTASSRELMDIVRTHPHHIYPVVRDGRVEGIATRDGILGHKGELGQEQVQTGYHTIGPDASAVEAFEMMASKRLSTILVIEPLGGRVVGIVTRIDVFNAMEHMDERHHAF